MPCVLAGFRATFAHCGARPRSKHRFCLGFGGRPRSKHKFCLGFGARPRSKHRFCLGFGARPRSKHRFCLGFGARPRSKHRFCLGFGARPRSKHRFTRGQASFTSFKELKEEVDGPWFKGHGAWLRLMKTLLFLKFWSKTPVKT